MSFWNSLQVSATVLTLLCFVEMVQAKSLDSDGIFPLSNVSDEHDFAPLATLTSQAKIVALGESFHTSEGFHIQRERIIRFLVEKKGVRTVFLESPWAEALVASKYVESCRGTSTEAVNSLLDVWRSKSFAQTLEWLCRYNKAHPNDRVMFAGVDNQNPWADAKIIRAFIYNKKFRSIALTNDLDKCVGAKSTSLESFKASPEWDLYVRDNQQVPQEIHDECLRSLEALQKMNLSTKAAIAVMSLQSWQKRWYFLNRDEQRFINDRDVGMYEIFNKLYMTRKKGRTILIGHNYHIAMSSNPNPQLSPMGTLLKKEYGPLYEAVGLIGYRVKINWPETQFKDQLPPLDVNSAEFLLHERYLGSVLVDTQTVFPQSTPLFIYNNGRAQPAIIKDQFRALVYLENSESRPPR